MQVCFPVSVRLAQRGVTDDGLDLARNTSADATEQRGWEGEVKRGGHTECVWVCCLVVRGTRARFIWDCGDAVDAPMCARARARWCVCMCARTCAIACMHACTWCRAIGRVVKVGDVIGLQANVVVAHPSHVPACLSAFLMPLNVTAACYLCAIPVCLNHPERIEEMRRTLRSGSSGDQVDELRMLELLGEGAFGKVYKGECIVEGTFLRGLSC